MRLVLALVAAIILVAGCAGAGPGADVAAHGWMSGIAVGGKPTCPTPTGEGAISCHLGPLPHARVLIASSTGSQTVRADARGRFRVALAPGRYVVRTGLARPVHVRILAGRVARIRVGIPGPR